MNRTAWKWIIVILFLPTISHAQSTRHSAIDSLSDYSYFLFGVKGGYFNKRSGTFAEFYLGTGFFVKMENRTFLVSAKHVLTPCNIIDTSRDRDFPDSFYVRVKSKKTNRYAILPLRRGRLNDTIQCQPYYEDADAFAMEIKGSEKYIIHSVENFIDEEISDSSILPEAYTCGFPNLQSLSFESLMKNKPKISKITMESKLNMVLVLGDGIYDTINYFANLDSGVLQSGNSGSPVYFQSKKDGHLIFGGLLSRGNARTHETYFVKPKEVVRKVKERL